MKIKKLLLLLIFFGCMHLEAASQELRIRNGLLKYRYYLNDESIDRTDFTNFLKQDETSWKHWERSKTYNTLSLIALTSEIGFALWGIIDKNPKNDKAADIGVYGSFAAVIAFSIISHVQKKKAVRSFNQRKNKTTAFTIRPSNSGFGLVVQF